MISIIRRSTRRTYEEAAETANRVPGLEGELAQERGRAGNLEQKISDLGKLLGERDGTIEKLRTELDSLRAAGDEIAALMAAAPSPAAVGYHAACILLAHAAQFRLDDTSEGRAGLEAMRELTEPQKVFLLYRNGRLTSAHATEEAARTQANRQGAAPDGWGHRSEAMSWSECARIIRSPWCIATVTVDAAAPWTTPREPLASVYVVIKDGLPYGACSSPDDAIREQDRLGIPHTAESLIRMELASADTTAAA